MKVRHFSGIIVEILGNFSCCARRNSPINDRRSGDVVDGGHLFVLMEGWGYPLNGFLKSGLKELDLWK